MITKGMSDAQIKELARQVVVYLKELMSAGSNATQALGLAASFQAKLLDDFEKREEWERNE